jgi:AGCS family alanine or glycine:cation symporter
VKFLNIQFLVEASNQLLNSLDFFFSQAVASLETIFFVSFAGIPLIILWIIFGGLFNTLRMGFINIRGFKHAIDIAIGKYDSSEENSDGEVSPAQALATALSGSIGLGNIAGVAIAIQLGGPGAIFWMSVAALLGMSSKFIECSLGVKYRLINPDGTVAGGPMYYLSQGLAELGLAKLGRILAFCFALFCVISTLGGGSMFQVNQSLAVLITIMPILANYDWLFGLLVACFVGLVIIGGISRIGVVSSKLMPVMISVYLIACFCVLIVKFESIPAAITRIIQEAFLPHAIEGGFIGVLIQGIRRSSFSNGAGLGTAAIAHAASQTTEPIQEGIVAMLEPFIDTILICNLTGLVIISSGIYTDADIITINGSQLATQAFASVINWFPYLLAIIILLFAFSTIITASYYGEQCWAYLCGQQTNFTFKAIFLISIFLGSIINLKTVLNFSDIMLLANSIPNLIGCILLSGKVAEDLKIYSGKIIFFSRRQAER